MKNSTRTMPMNGVKIERFMILYFIKIEMFIKLERFVRKEMNKFKINFYFHSHFTRLCLSKQLTMNEN